MAQFDAILSVWGDQVHAQQLDTRKVFAKAQMYGARLVCAVGAQTQMELGVLVVIVVMVMGVLVVVMAMGVVVVRLVVSVVIAVVVSLVMFGFRIAVRVCVDLAWGAGPDGFECKPRAWIVENRQGRVDRSPLSVVARFVLEADDVHAGRGQFQFDPFVIDGQVDLTAAVDVDAVLAFGLRVDGAVQGNG